jgi:two-component system sensor histidine kinase YesM
MSAARLQDLRDKKFTLTDSEEGTGGHGLMNVHRRIVLRYGSLYGIKIESSLEQGTTISLTLPIIEADMEGGNTSA